MTVNPTIESMIAVRPATDEDLPSVLDLYVQPGMDDHKLSPAEAKAIFARMRSYPDYALMVADEGGRIVGTLALLIMDNLGHLGAKSAVVEDVVVDPTRHGQGIGKILMHAAMALAAAKGCYKMTLSSNLKRAAAHAFYDGLGFRRHGYSFWIDLPAAEVQR